MSYTLFKWHAICRWIVMLMIGVFTAFVAFFINCSINFFYKFKLLLLDYFLQDCVFDNVCNSLPALFFWLLWASLFCGVAVLMVVYGEMVTAGSGIPQVKCYLNGVKIPHVVRIKTLIIKVFGVIASVVGGLIVGKEGPMIHSGAVIAAGVSQGRSRTLNFDTSFFKAFRTDTEKRDFISAGAAAGVSAAFGAPLGGVLFSLEEGASFWNQQLTWRILFASMVSTFTLNVLLSAYSGHPGELSNSGLINFGKLKDISFNIREVPLYLLFGLFGGLLGALFNHINYRLTIFRNRYMKKKFLKVLEVISVAAATVSIGFLSVYLMKDCQPITNTNQVMHKLQYFCPEGHFNSIASLIFSTPEENVITLFHAPISAFNYRTLFFLFFVFFFLSCWTYGLCVPSGLFIPCLLIGATWGRLISMMVQIFFPGASWASPSKMAFVGAAAQLGGVVRMTLSLTVILIEATGSITFGLALMLVLVLAKWIGDYFNEGIYDIHIKLQGVPILGWNHPPFSLNITASEIMSHPVVVLRTIEKIGDVISTLKNTTHNGFPVVDTNLEHTRLSFGRFRGIISRCQLLTLIQHFAKDKRSSNMPTLEEFRNQYPRRLYLKDLNLSPQITNQNLDLRPFMKAGPYTLLFNATLPRVFRLFRALGLRHLVVTNEKNEVVGMITRKDIARYRFHTSSGRSELKEMQFIQFD